MLYRNLAGAASMLAEWLKAGMWFGFTESAKALWLKLEEMQQFFFTKQIPDKAVLQHMKDYLHCTGRKKGDGKKLVGALAAEKLLLYAPLLCRVCGTRPSKLFD